MNDLTNKWKKGELPYAEYYIKLGGGEYTNDVWDIDSWQYFNKEGDEVIEVLAPVPSYDEYWHMISCLNDQTEILNENIKLKELLKECCKYINWKTDHYIIDGHDKKQELFDKIDEVLK